MESRRLGQRECSGEAARLETAHGRRSTRPARLATFALLGVAAVALTSCGEGSEKSSNVAAATTPTTAATTAPAGTGSATTPTATATTPASGSTHTATSQTAPTPAPAGGAKHALGAKAATKLFKALGFGKLTLTSTAFTPGGPIDTRYTCDGEGISPPMQWQRAPQGAAQLLLFANDFGGGANATVQWAVAMPATVSSIPAGSLPPGAVAGVNSAGKIGWGGLCGAKGKTQHVTFLLYAVRHKLNLQSGFNPAQARRALKGNNVGTGFTLATYKRA